MPFRPATKEDLRIGLFIKLVGNWFAHPFSKNSFKIKDEKDLATLYSLRNYKILYDPERSDPLPSSEMEDDSCEDVKTSLDPSSPPIGENHQKEISPYINSPEKLQANQVRLEKLKEAEKNYQVVLKQNIDSIREVKAGYAKGVRKAENLVNTLGEILDQNGTLVSLMNFLGNQETGDDFNYHSLNVCMLSMVLGQGLDLPQDFIKTLGIGALFHDIGELEGGGMFIKKDSKMNKHEQQFLRNHPKNGRKMIEGFGFPKPRLEVISQHHERLNGTGYPAGLKEDSSHLLSKIVMVADAYDELCNNPQFEKSLTPHEAISRIYAKRQDEFWEEAVLSLIQNLGVYPPSSIVEMSDGTFGMVTSINLIDRMRPTVMLYNSDIPREEAIIVDLQQEPTLTIKLSMRPKNVPRKIWKYLNPRGMISYFAYNPDPTPAPKPQESQSTQPSPVLV
jgi:HD-GYP domain-containing protein (c-di-GMP phosphodiesterase class II)